MVQHARRAHGTAGMTAIMAHDCTLLSRHVYIHKAACPTHVSAKVP